MMLPILIGLGLFVFGSAAGGKKKKVRTPTLPPGPGSPCDPLVTEGLPPGYGCYQRNDGNFYITKEADPAAPPPLNYGPFVDDQGVDESLTLLGFEGALKAKIAAFQRYALSFFKLQDGSLRTDGRLDNKTIDYLGRAMTAYEGDRWTSPSTQAEEDDVIYREFENGWNIVDAWKQMPVYEWELPNGEVKYPDEGATVASWLANIVYWGTYGAGELGSDAPIMFFPIPGTSQWDAEAKYREAWMRIHSIVEHRMVEVGVPNTQITENVA